MAEQYGVSPEQLKLIRLQHERRTKNRAYLQQQVHNPHKGSHGGHVFDPAMQRFNTMTYTAYDYFVPTPGKALKSFFAVIVPMCLLGYAVNKQRTEKERAIRAGELRYRDRLFKLI